MTTIWWCERCHASGEFDRDKDTSVYEVIEVLRSSHDAHSLAWREHCTFDTAHVRARAARDGAEPGEQK